MKTISKIQIADQSTKDQIIAIAEKNNCKWVVCFADHYRGNSKGHYYDITDFAKLKKINWSNEPNDRGVMNCFVTSDDVPAAIAARRELTTRLNAIDYALSELQRNKGNLIPIDGRWSSANPKRITAEASNAAIHEAFAAQAAPLLTKKDELIKELASDRSISSSMYQVRF